MQLSEEHATIKGHVIIRGSCNYPKGIQLSDGHATFRGVYNFQRGKQLSEDTQLLEGYVTFFREANIFSE
jgi:hypothetical protein